MSLLILPNFKGTKKQEMKAIAICLIIDSLILLSI